MPFDWREYVTIDIRDPALIAQVEEVLESLSQVPEGQALIRQARELSGPITIADHGEYSIGGQPITADQHNLGGGGSSYAQTFRLSEGQYESAMFLNVENFDEATETSITHVIVHEFFHFADPEHNIDHRYQEIRSVIESFADASLVAPGLTPEQREVAVAAYVDVIAEEIGVTEENMRADPSQIEYFGAGLGLEQFNPDPQTNGASNKLLEEDLQPQLPAGGITEQIRPAGAETEERPPVVNVATPLSQEEIAARVNTRLAEQGITGVIISPDDFATLSREEMDGFREPLGGVFASTFSSYEEDAVDYTDAFMMKYFGETTARETFRSPMPAAEDKTPGLVCAADFPTFISKPVTIEALGNVPLQAPSVGPSPSAACAL